MVLLCYKLKIGAIIPPGQLQLSDLMSEAIRLARAGRMNPTDFAKATFAGSTLELRRVTRPIIPKVE